MGNLIVSVIAIALVAVVSMIAAYYGGSVFRGYLTDADASRLLSEQDQIVGAITMFNDDSGKQIQEECPSEGLVLKLDCLVDLHYLQDLPGNGKTAWSIFNNQLRANIGSDETAKNSCQAARKQLGFTGDILPCCVESGNPTNPMACTSRTAAVNPNLDSRDPCCSEP